MPRRPDGVVVDPSTELPSPEEVASSEAGVATLRSPLAEPAARKLVRAFFRAIVREDLPALASLLTVDASFTAPAGGPKARVLDVYRTRMQRFDYLPLEETRLYDDLRIETYRFDDFDQGWPLPIARPSAMNRADLVLRIPLSITQTSAGRLFGDEIVLVIGREGREPRIRAVSEEFLGW